jgi:hypothetical protein
LNVCGVAAAARTKSCALFTRPVESRWKKIWSVVSRPMLERFWESATRRLLPATRA